MSELPPGVPQPGQPILPGMHPDEQLPPGMPHPGINGPQGPFLGPHIPPQDMPIYTGEFVQTPDGTNIPQGGVHPGFVEGQPEGCCPPEVYAGQTYPYPVPGSQQTGSGGHGGSNTPSSVWRNDTHTRWTVSFCFFICQVFVCLFACFSFCLFACFCFVSLLF